MKHFLQLFRVVNLFIIVVTMVGVAFFVMRSNRVHYIEFNALDYGLLVLTTVIIAAAGNLINDYFDVKADRVNRPKRLIITRHLKKRWAIFIHWSLNIAAIFFSIILTIRYNSFLFLFVHLLAMNLLWFYSTYFKKKLFIGNVVIALLTALVPLLSVWYFKTANEGVGQFSPYRPESWGVSMDYSFVYFTVACAFFTNLAREISKDIQDVAGDKLIHVYSLPMKYGVKKAGWIAILILQIPLFMGIAAFQINWVEANWVSIFFLSIGAILNLSCLVLHVISKEFPFEKINLIIKWSMLIGVCTLFTNAL